MTLHVFNLILFSSSILLLMIVGFKGSYSYKSEAINEYDLEPNLRVRIERVDNNIATLFFVNDNGESILVPENTEIRETSDQTVQRPRFNVFFITWIGSYGLFRNGVQVLSLTNQKQQSVSSSQITGHRIHKNGAVVEQRRTRVIIEQINELTDSLQSQLLEDE